MKEEHLGELECLLPQANLLCLDYLHNNDITNGLLLFFSNLINSSELAQKYVLHNTTIIDTVHSTLTSQNIIVVYSALICMEGISSCEYE